MASFKIIITKEVKREKVKFRQVLGIQRGLYYQVGEIKRFTYRFYKVRREKAKPNKKQDTSHEWSR